MCTESRVDTVYYDGACPLCSREINQLCGQKQAPFKAVDIHQLDASEASEMPDKEILLRRLHLKTAEGEWLKGLDANIYAWRDTPFAWLWRLLKIPGVHFFADKAYEFWAAKRTRRNSC